MLPARSPRAWIWCRCPGPQIVPIRTEPGPSKRRAGTRSRGASGPGPRTRRDQGRSGGECRELYPRDRNACAHPCSRDCDARTQCRLLTVMLEGKYTDAYLAQAGSDAPKYTTEDLRIISSPIDFVGLNVYTPDHYVVAADNERGFTLAPFPKSFPHMKAAWLRPGPEAIYWLPP